MGAINRRKFLKQGAGCCIIIAGAGSFVFAADSNPDPKKLNYCGYTCPEKCEMFVAGKSDSDELKHAAFKAWRFEEKYGLAYSPELVYCERCKTKGKVTSTLLTKCSVRNCAINKGYDCCIQCNELKTCDKEIWKTFPEFKIQVLKMQEAYQA